MQMVGGAITNAALFAAVPSTGSLVLPAGTGAVAGVLVVEATFSGALGAKEVYIDEVVLTKT
jgi:hypothetical protein